MKYAIDNYNNPYFLYEKSEEVPKGIIYERHKFTQLIDSLLRIKAIHDNISIEGKVTNIMAWHSLRTYVRICKEVYWPYPFVNKLEWVNLSSVTPESILEARCMFDYPFITSLAESVLRQYKRLHSPSENKLRAKRNSI